MYEPKQRKKTGYFNKKAGYGCLERIWALIRTCQSLTSFNSCCTFTCVFACNTMAIRYSARYSRYTKEENSIQSYQENTCDGRKRCLLPTKVLEGYCLYKVCLHQENNCYIWSQNTQDSFYSFTFQFKTVKKSTIDRNHLWQPLGVGRRRQQEPEHWAHWFYILVLCTSR